MYVHTEWHVSALRITNIGSFDGCFPYPMGEGRVTRGNLQNMPKSKRLLSGNAIDETNVHG